MSSMLEERDWTRSGVSGVIVFKNSIINGVF